MENGLKMLKYQMMVRFQSISYRFFFLLNFSANSHDTFETMQIKVNDQIMGKNEIISII